MTRKFILDCGKITDWNEFKMSLKEFTFDRMKLLEKIANSANSEFKKVVKTEPEYARELKSVYEAAMAEIEAYEKFIGFYDGY